MKTLFDEDRLTLDKAIMMAIATLIEYGVLYKHWAVAYSGGKDSSLLVTLLYFLISTQQIAKPESLTVIYADTRMELPPLHQSAMNILDKLRGLGIDCRVVLPRLDHRFFVYMLGRGVPPPSNTFRWCTPKLKVMSMERELEVLRQQTGEKFLMLTGVRIGESAARDQRIALSCSKNGGECGQGWFQQTSSKAVADTLAPILHFRVCHVWDWLMWEAPSLGFDTQPLAEVYGMTNRDGEEPLDARTGCFKCPLVQEDRTLKTVIQIPDWAYLSPLERLGPLYAELKKFSNRLQKDGFDQRADGSFEGNRKGPLTIEAREWGLAEVLAIESDINRAATALGRPQVSLINEEELAMIQRCIADRVFPEGWDGTEPNGADLLPQVLKDGSIQQVLFSAVSE